MPPPLFSFRAYRVVVVVVIAIYYPLRYKNMITSNASSRPTAPISAALTPGVSATPRILGSLPLRPASTAHATTTALGAKQHHHDALAYVPTMAPASASASSTTTPLRGGNALMRS